MWLLSDSLNVKASPFQAPPQKSKLNYFAEHTSLALLAKHYIITVCSMQYIAWDRI